MLAVTCRMHVLCKTVNIFDTYNTLPQGPCTPTSDNRSPESGAHRASLFLNEKPLRLCTALERTLRLQTTLMPKTDHPKLRSSTDCGGQTAHRSSAAHWARGLPLWLHTCTISSQPQLASMPSLSTLKSRPTANSVWWSQWRSSASSGAAASHSFTLMS